MLDETEWLWEESTELDQVKSGWTRSTVKVTRHRFRRVNIVLGRRTAAITAKTSQSHVTALLSVNRLTRSTDHSFPM